MDALKHVAEQAQTGHGQIVAVMAEPGVGKSRLFYEFKATSKSGWMVLEAFSVSHGKASAYLPVLDLLSQYFEIGRDDDRKRRERVLGKVLGLDRALEETLPYLYSLQGIADTGDSLAQMDPQIRRRRTLDAIKRILLRESINQPLISIFEDLHWIDSETQALLNLLVDAIANARILLLVNYRPEYRHEWGSRTHYTQLRLDPLGPESAEEMLATLLGDAKDLTPLRRLIIERTQGTPFFMEEMVQALFEERVLQRNGTVKLARPINAVKVPATVQAVLASRIDRLSAPEKELLQTLAVLGREFALKIVQRVALKTSDELEQVLDRLQLGEFIYERPAVGEVEYSFKHALTQEVAYKLLLSERRRALHDRAARTLEELYAEQLNDHYGDIAHHYLLSDDAAKAIHYARLAAEQALNRAAYPQAMSLIEAALKLLEKLPEGAGRSSSELGLRTIESTVAMVLHGASSKEREGAIKRMCELAQNIGTADQFLRALSTLSGLYFTQGEPSRGLELARRCLKLGQASQDEGLFLDALYNAGMLATRCGNFREAISYLEQAAHRARQTNGISEQWGSYHVGDIGTALAEALHLRGFPENAAEAAKDALAHARRSGHMLSVGGFLIVGWGLLGLYRRQADIARIHCEEAIALSEENGFAEWIPWGRFIRGWAIFQLGQLSEGLAEMNAGIVGFQQLGGVPRLQYLLAVRAEAISRVGRAVEALGIVNEGLNHIARSGEDAELSEILRLKGEVLLMGNRFARAEAEQCFREAVVVARAQEAKWWELRSSVSLARVLRDTNRRDEARTMLAEIYNWFIDGFELPDLKEAKALLEELGTEQS